MPQVGLYYPYIHIRSERWVKAAALYWPRLARVVSDGYPVRDARCVQVLNDEFGFVVPARPATAVAGVAALWGGVLTEHSEQLVHRYGIAPDAHRHRRTLPRPPQPLAEDTPHSSGPPDRPHMAALYTDELTPDLCEALVDAGLATVAYEEVPWVIVHPEVAWIYKCVLVEELARQSGYAPTTDQASAVLVPGRWDGQRIADALLTPSAGSSAPAASELAAAIGLLAVDIVVPHNLAHVPVEKIVELRRRHTTEFHAFTAEVATAATELSEQLVDATLPDARALHLRLEVERRFETPLTELRKAMGSLGLDTTLGALNLKFDLPATVAATTGGVAAGNPVIGVASGAAFALTSLGRAHTQARSELRSASPAAAYLLSVERGLNSPRLLKRLTSRRRSAPR